MGVGTLLLHLGAPPNPANTMAFGVAFLISYFGHREFSFPSACRQESPSFLRFCATSSLGFGANTATFNTLLFQTSLELKASLLLSTTASAILTFILCKLWVFDKNQP